MPCVYAPGARSRAVVFGSALLATSAVAWTSLRADTPAPERPAVAPKQEQIKVVASTGKLELTSGASLCVSGRVRIGREPVPGASLTVSYGGRHPGDHARSDEAGQFQLDCWPGLKNRIILRRVGKTRDLELREPGPSRWLDIDLPGGRVEGRVLAAQGAPMPGIEVGVYSTTEPTPWPLFEVRTDASGRYVLWLVSGRYELRTSRRQGGPLRSVADLLPGQALGKIVVDVRDRAHISGADLVLEERGMSGASCASRP